MINVGVIGCGRIAQERHLPEYSRNENVNIMGVFDLNQGRAEETAKRYGAVAYGSYEELLNDPKIDAVSVCAANYAHAEITTAALRDGKHVLCEKPMAVTLEQCKEMVRTAKKCGKFLMIGHNQRLAKAHGEAKKLLQEGCIGKILTFRTCFAHGGPETWTMDRDKVWFFDKSQSAFGAMADLGIHKTDLIQFLTGQKVCEVTAVLDTLDKKNSDGTPIGVDDNAVCIYKLDGGILGTMTASWTCYGPEDNSTVLYGTQGRMRIYDDPEYAVMIEKKDGTTIRYELDQIQTNDAQTDSGVINLWIQSLMTDTEPEISGQEALSAMEAVFAAVQSSQMRRTVNLEELR